MRSSIVVSAVLLRQCSCSAFVPVETRRRAFVPNKATVADVGHDYELDLIHSKAELDKLMHSKQFRSALNSEDDVDVYHGTAVPKQGYHEEDEDCHTITETEADLLQKRAALDHLMQQKGYLSALDTEPDTDIETSGDDCLLLSGYEEEMLQRKKALDDLMSSKGFRSALEVEGSNKVDTHLHTLVVGEEDMHTATGSDFELAMLRGKGALDRLMQSEDLQK